MKKWLSLLLAFAMLLSCIAAAAEDVAEEPQREAETVEEAVEEPVFAGEDELVLYNKPGVDEPSVIHGVQFNNILTEVDSVNGYGNAGYSYSNATLRNSAYYYYDLYDEADYDGTKYVFNGGAESNSFDAGADDTAVKQRIAEKNTDGDRCIRRQGAGCRAGRYGKLLPPGGV